MSCSDHEGSGNAETSTGCYRGCSHESFSQECFVVSQELAWKLPLLGSTTSDMDCADVLGVWGSHHLLWRCWGSGMLIPGCEQQLVLPDFCCCADPRKAWGRIQGKGEWVSWRCCCAHLWESVLLPAPALCPLLTWLVANTAGSLERPVSTKQLQQNLVLNLTQASLRMNKSTSCDFFHLWFPQVVAMIFEALFVGPKDVIL